MSGWRSGWSGAAIRSRDPRSPLRLSSRLHHALVTEQLARASGRQRPPPGRRFFPARACRGRPGNSAPAVRRGVSPPQVAGAREPSENVGEAPMPGVWPFGNRRGDEARIKRKLQLAAARLGLRGPFTGLIRRSRILGRSFTAGKPVCCSLPLSPIQAGFPVSRCRVVALRFGRPLKAALPNSWMRSLPAVNGRPKPDFVGRKPPEGGSHGITVRGPMGQHIEKAKLQTSAKRRRCGLRPAPRFAP